MKRKRLKLNMFGAKFVGFSCMILPAVVLQVNPSEIWLRDECDDSAYFPDQDSQFNLQDCNITPYSTLVVEGATASGLNMIACSPSQWPISQQQSFAFKFSWPSCDWSSHVLLRGCTKEASLKPDKNHEGQDDTNSKEGREAGVSVHRVDVYRVDRCNGQRWTPL